MYRKLGRSTGNILGYHVSGKVTKAEVMEIQEDVDRTIREHGRFRMLAEIGDLEMPEASAIWQDLKMTPEYLKHGERVALVGEARWEEWLTRAADKLTGMDARFFHRDQSEMAWDWVAGPA